jgi:dienelactone hydrolase
LLTDFVEGGRMIILLVVGIIVGIIILYLAVVTFAPGFSVPKQPLVKIEDEVRKETIKPPSFRKDVTFEAKGTKVSAWFYLPEDLSTPVPCIIMGHGFGGTKDILLERYAIHYRNAGYAVLAFDYRYFGTSGGEPRQLMFISYQLEDYRAAVKYVRSLKEIDSEKIVLWGTSASGGYGIVLAAQDKKIAGVVAQCPGLDHKASEQMIRDELGIKHVLRLFVHAQRDMMRARLGLSPHKIPLVGKPGTMAFLPILEAYEGYRKIVSKHFVNEICARVILRSHGFNPSKHIQNVRCPILIQICDHDKLAPIRPETERELRKHAEVKRYPIGHFEIYAGDNFKRAVNDQLEFFEKNLT